MENKVYLEKLRELLQQKGYKMTSQRIDILQYLLKYKSKHLSCEEIHDGLKVENPNIGLATVYRTLQLLLNIGLVSKLDFDDGRSRYELADEKEDHNHHHLICLNCGKIIEVEVDLMDSIEKDIEATYDFKIFNHSVKFYGVCNDCKDDSENNEKTKNNG